MPHIHDKIDYTVEVFIVHKNKVLLRLHDKYKIWLSVGGHIELHEDPNQAALREVREEVGLDVVLLADLLPFEMKTEKHTELIPPKFMNRHRISPTHEHVVLTYFATSKTDEVKVEDASDASPDWKWVTKEELDVMGLERDILFYAKQALQELAS